MRLPKQFSLRAMGALVLLVCVLLASWVSDSKEQQSATKAVRDFGGRVTYDEPPSLVPQFIIRGLGHDYTCGVESITLYPTAVADADEQIAVLKELPELRKLAIWPGCAGLTTAPTDAPGGLTDDGVEFLLGSLPKLKHLSLLSARITQVGEGKLLAKTTISSLQYHTHSAFGSRSGGRP